MKTITQLLTVTVMSLLACKQSLMAQQVSLFHYFSTGPGPNGVAVDNKGNVYTQTGPDLFNYNGLYKFAPDGTLLLTKSFYPNNGLGVGQLRMAMDPNNNLIWAIEKMGNLYTIDPATLQANLVISFSLLSGVTVSPVYNTASGQNTSLTFLTPMFGDIAAFRSDSNHLVLFITGVSDNGNPPRGFPFVLRLDVTGTNLTSAKCIVTRIDAAAGPILYNEPRGIAVNKNGVVVTTLPKTVIPYEESLDYPVAFGWDFPANGSTSPHYISTSGIYALGMAPDNSGNFYVTFSASGAIGTPVCGGSGVFLLPNSLDLNNGQCLEHDLTTVFTDASVGALNDFAYVSLNDANMIMRISIPQTTLIPCFDSVSTTNGYIYICAECPTNSTTILEQSSTLQNWTPCLTNTARNPVWTVSQPMNISPLFFRLKAQ